MKPNEVIQVLLEYRAYWYFTNPTDEVGRPIMTKAGRKYDDPKKWKKIFDWRIMPAAVYSHKPPFAGQLDLVRATPFGTAKITRITCDNTPYIKYAEKNFKGCKNAESFVTKHKGGLALQRGLQGFLEQDAAAFFFALCDDIEPKIKVTGRIPFIDSISSLEEINHPRLRVDLTFPLPQVLTAEKILTHIEVI